MKFINLRFCFIYVICTMLSQSFLIAQNMFELNSLDKFVELKIKTHDKRTFKVAISKRDTINIFTLPNQLNGTVRLNNCDQLHQLGFPIIDYYFSNAYCYESKSLGKVILLESYFPGATGRLANVVNVSMIFVKSKCIRGVLSFNSYFRGVNLVSEEAGKFYINVLYRTDREHNTKPIYCRSIFEINRNFMFEPVESDDNGCYYPMDFSSKIMKKINTCFECEQKKTPFGYKYPSSVKSSE